MKEKNLNRMEKNLIINLLQDEYKHQIKQQRKYKKSNEIKEYIQVIEQIMLKLI
ncbi:MAG: hypothetical protein J6M60_03515 [Clostridia bacterium]|nr:hypothetical protein [Clostridia bacterium]